MKAIRSNTLFKRLVCSIVAGLIFISGPPIVQTCCAEPSTEDNEDIYSSSYIDPSWDNGFEQSLADVATVEAYAIDACELPAGSDKVKYNRWYYGTEVMNSLKDGEYKQQYNWNTVFVCWCASKIGMVEFGRFPKTNDSDDLYCQLVEQKNLNLSKEELSSGKYDFQLAPSDLIFFPDENGYTVGIITQVTENEVIYVIGDFEYGVARLSKTIDLLPDNVHFIRISTAENADIYAFISFCCNRLNIEPAAACGVYSDVLTESSLNPKAIGDARTSYGICQWHKERWDRMIEFCDEHGYNWRKLEGQMEYLVYDLQTDYEKVLKKLRTCDNSPDGAYLAAYYFSTEYEMPYAAEHAADICGEFAAKELYPALWIR